MTNFSNKYRHRAGAAAPAKIAGLLQKYYGLINLNETDDFILLESITDLERISRLKSSTLLAPGSCPVPSSSLLFAF